MENREIKFRGKSKDIYSEWVFGYYVKARSRHYIVEEWNSEVGNDERWMENEGWVEVIPETVGQYIGTDFLNNKIYENDVVKNKCLTTWIIGFDNEKNCYKYGQLKRNDLSNEDNAKALKLIFSLTKKEIIREKLEVIGNKFENPELLNE